MRPPRIDFPGARHHVMNRGARKAPIFTGAASRELFLTVLGELPQRFGVRIHAFALMPNHYHVMLESERGHLSRAMRHLGGEYTRRVNRLHRWDGPLFRGRYHNRLVDTDTYWQHLLLYIHLNPERAGLPRDASWTSHEAYLDTATAPDWLTTAELLGALGGVEDYRAAYEALRDGRAAPLDAFDPDALWTPNAAGLLDPPPYERAYTMSDGFDDLCAVTGLTPEEILDVPRGPLPNKANWLAAWWWSQCGLDHGEIRRAMVTTHASVSLKIRRVQQRRETDPELGAWTRALWERKNARNNS